MVSITGVVTFTNGTAVALSAMSEFAGLPNNFGVSKIFIQPSDANTHKCYLGDEQLALGSSTVAHVIKRLAKPSAADATLDSFLIESQAEGNTLHLTDYSMDGTTSEQAQVTIWVA